MIINGLSPHGGDTFKNKVKYDFSQNTNPFKTPDEVKEAIIKQVDNIDKYPDPYCISLREKISEKEKVNIDYILCGNGAADLIFSFSFALKAKKALILAPTFSEYASSLEASETKIDYYIYKKENNYTIDENIYDMIDDNYDCVFLCNPNNPTGALIEKNYLKRLISKCEKNNTIVFLDECFNDLIDKPDEYSLVDELENYQNLIILKAFTKSYGMAGVRLGYCLSKNRELLNKMSSTTQTWNVSSVANAAGIAALESGDFLEKSKEIIKEERKYLMEELTRLNYEVYPPSANYIFFKGKIGLKEELLKSEILIRSCENYIGLNGEYYRIAVKLHEENKILINELEKISWQK